MCFMVAIIRNVKFGFGEAQAMYFFSGASLLMYLWRRHLRKRDEENDGRKMQ